MKDFGKFRYYVKCINFGKLKIPMFLWALDELKRITKGIFYDSN
jgi:hypothetical protein